MKKLPAEIDVWQFLTPVPQATLRVQRTMLARARTAVRAVPRDGLRIGDGDVLGITDTMLGILEDYVRARMGLEPEPTVRRARRRKGANDA